jgi:prevent-host-death family protein
VSERTAVYRLFAVDDTLLYVGVGREFGVRWERHAKTQPWWPHVDHQTVQWYPGREDALAAEDQAIKSERPVYNIAGSPWIGGIKDDGTGFFVITKPVKLAPAKAAHRSTSMDMAIADARAHWSDVIARVRHTREPVILTNRGTPQAAIVPAEIGDAIEAVGGPDKAAELLRQMLAADLDPTATI